VTAARRRRAEEFQTAYLLLARRAARLTGRSTASVFAALASRSASVNAYARVTGDAVAHAAVHLTRRRAKLGPDALYEIIDRFAELRTAPDRPDAKRVFDELLALAVETRDGL
jgi:hypothetical protein